MYQTFSLPGNSRIIRKFDDIAYDFPSNGVVVNAGEQGVAIVVDTVAKGLASIAFSNHGAGYTTVPAVTFTGGSGTGMAGVAAIDITTGTVTGIEITNGGTGYSSAPTIGFSGGGGEDAAGTATVNLGLGTVTGVTITNGGDGYYLNAPTVTFTNAVDDVTGTGAAGTAIIDALTGKVTGVTMSNNGLLYTDTPTVSFTSVPTTPAAATATLSTNALVMSVTFDLPSDIQADTATWTVYTPGAVSVGDDAYIIIRPSPTGILLAGPASGAAIMC